MYRRAPFIWTRRQAIVADRPFHDIVSRPPVRREDGQNRWFLFRRSFTLPAPAERASLSITVDGRYKLSVNGAPVGRGPVRCSPHFQRLDRYDVAPHLVCGENVLAVLVHVYGVDTSWYETVKGYWQPFFGDGGLYCELDIDCRDGTFLTILTDEDWRCLDCPAWNRETPRGGWGQGFIEDFDANAMPEGWADPSFDDRAWEGVQALVVEPDTNQKAMGWGRIEPFPSLVANDLPPLQEYPVAPVEVLACYGVVPEPDLSLDRRLYEERLEDCPPALVDSPRALLTDDAAVTTVRTLPGRDVSLLIAFEKIHAGYPFIEVEAGGGEIIELAVSETYGGEFDAEPPRRPRLQRATHLDGAHLFRYTARPGAQRFEKFEWTAIRYAQLTVRNAHQGIKLRHVGSIATHYPARQAGRFDCSDDRLNRLWEIGCYTALQCTHDAWEDCPGREKRQWIGDGIVHYLVGAAAFGPSTQPVDRKFLFDAAHSQRPDGLVQMFAPGDHYTNGVVIPDYSLHWICGAYEYHLHTGDEEAIAGLFPGIQRALAWFERQIGPHDLIVNLPFWHFIEWADVGREGEAAPLNALFAGTLRAAAKMAEWLGYERAAARYGALADRIAAALNRRHWDEARGVYVDVVDPASGKQDRRVSQHANAAMILWDVAPPQRWPSMIRRIADPGRLKLTAVPPIVLAGEAFDPEEDVVKANTFFSHFVFSALAKAGRFEVALDLMRRNYKRLLDSKAATFWEGYEPTASLCHVFSATPVHQLSAHALGIRPTEPGFRRFKCAPQPADLSRAAGVYPTVKGAIEVSWQCKAEGMSLTLTVPQDTVAEIASPPGHDEGKTPSVLEAGRHTLFFPRAS